MELHSHDVYGRPEFPQHAATFQLSNLSDMSMNDVHFVGVVQNQQGDAVDILYHDSDRMDIAPDETIWFTVKSRSSSGRCVGPVDPEGYVLHYWLNFVTATGEPITRYYTSEIN